MQTQPLVKHCTLAVTAALKGSSPATRKIFVVLCSSFCRMSQAYKQTTNRHTEPTNPETSVCRLDVTQLGGRHTHTHSEPSICRLDVQQLGGKHTQSPQLQQAHIQSQASDD